MLKLCKNCKHCGKYRDSHICNSGAYCSTTYLETIKCYDCCYVKNRDNNCKQFEKKITLKRSLKYKLIMLFRYGL